MDNNLRIWAIFVFYAIDSESDINEEIDEVLREIYKAFF